MICAVQIIRSNYERVFNRTGYSFCKQLAYGILRSERYSTIYQFDFYPFDGICFKLLCFFVQGAFIAASAAVSPISLDEHWCYRVLDAVLCLCPSVCTKEVIQWSFALALCFYCLVSNMMKICCPIFYSTLLWQK